MSRRVRVSKQAKADLDEIWEWIARDRGIEAATRLIDADFSLPVQIKFLEPAFRVFLGDLSTLVGTTRPAVIALVHANKNMLLVVKLVSHFVLGSGVAGKR